MQNPGVSWAFSTLFQRCEFIIFVDNGDGMLREIGQVTETVDGSTFPSTDIYDWPTADPALTADGHDKTKASTENDTPITLVVLSERAWANMTWTQVPAANNGYYGKVGRYLFDQMMEFTASLPDNRTWPSGECWSLGDSPTIGLLLNPQPMLSHQGEAPVIGEDMSYHFTGKGRQIRIYDDVNVRFILEDMFCKLRLNYGDQKNN